LLARTNIKLTAGGRLTLTPGGNKTLHTSALTIDSASTLDLADNDLVVNDPVSFTAIQNLVLSGFGATTGITSSTSDGSQILALFDNALVGAIDWNGTPIDPDAVVGKYTYFGDMNLDGQVTGDDYTVVDASLNTDPAPGLEWLSGDANLDGMITSDDYTVIDANLGLGTDLPLAASRTSVPEPSVALLVLISSLPRRRPRPQP
jgi:hypothetical protein